MCNRQLSGIAEDYEKFLATGAKILAISSEEPTRGREILHKLDLPYTLLTDPEHKVIELYGVLVKKREMKDIPALTHHRTVDYAIPSVFIIDREGRIRRESIVNFFYAGQPFICDEIDEHGTISICLSLNGISSILSVGNSCSRLVR